MSQRDERMYAPGQQPYGHPTHPRMLAGSGPAPHPSYVEEQQPSGHPQQPQQQATGSYRRTMDQYPFVAPSLGYQSYPPAYYARQTPYSTLGQQTGPSMSTVGPQASQPAPSSRSSRRSTPTSSSLAHAAGTDDQVAIDPSSVEMHPHPATTSMELGKASSSAAGPSSGSGKARSAIACVLCRRQKMKCEGPEKAPCKRCLAAGVDCVFEAAAATQSRAKPGPSDAWVENRLSQFDRRISALEHESDPRALRSPSSVSLEQRVAQLEAHLVSLTLAHGRQSNDRSTISNIRESGYPNEASYPNNGDVSMSSQSTMSSWHANSRNEHATTGAHIKREPSSIVDEADAERQHRRRKRHKSSGADGDGSSKAAKAGLRSNGDDLVARGVLSEDEAMLCFESYFINFEHQNPVESAAPASPANGDSSNGYLRAIHLPYAETRRQSKLLWSTLISIGGRSLSHFDTYLKALDEAVSLCRLCSVPMSDDEEPNDLDLRGIMLLAMYNSLGSLVPLGISLSYKFDLPTALFRFDRLSDAEKATPKGAGLISQGRTFLLVYFWTSIYAVSRGIHGGFELTPEVIDKQLEILEASEYSQQPTERVLRIHCEECIILKRVFDEFGPGRRIDPPEHKDCCRIIDQALKDLDEWANRFAPAMELVSQWGSENPELTSTIPVHHGRMSVLSWILSDSLQINDETRKLPGLRRYAQIASESGTAIIRWGVESRIWVPHSMVAQYLHFVNIPSALRLLDKATRLFPEDANFPAIRRLLFRLQAQCDAQIAADTGTPAELKRAIETKEAVMHLDRYAFQHNDEPQSQLTLSQRRATLTEDDVQASLSSSMRELNLWGYCLLDCLAVPA